MNYLSISSLSLALMLGSSLVKADNEGGEDWAGLYAGIAVGHSSNSTSPSTKVMHNGYFNTNSNGSDEEQLNPILQRKIDGTTLSGSLLLGYHFQTNKLLYGLEADLTLAHFSESESEGPTAFVSQPGNDFTSITKIETDYMLSLRPKIGYVRNGILMHFSAGPVISKFSTTHNYTDNYGVGGSIAFKDKKTVVGLSVNLGVDYPVTQNLALRADYTYSYFSDVVEGSEDINNDNKTDIIYGADFVSQNVRVALTKRF